MDQKIKSVGAGWGSDGRMASRGGQGHVSAVGAWHLGGLSQALKGELEFTDGQGWGQEQGLPS